MPSIINVASASAGPVNLGPGFALIVNVPAPTDGSAEYLLVVRFTTLDAANELTVREGYAEGNFDNMPVASGATNSIIEVELTLDSGDAAVPVSVRDTGPSPSSAAHWAYDLYQRTGGGGAGKKLVSITEEYTVTSP